MYMAPEMVTSHQYTEKVDVFSATVMLFEALRGRLNVQKLAVAGEPGALQEYAEGVAAGFREEIPSNWPAEVRSLIEDGWHHVCSSHEAVPVSSPTKDCGRDRPVRCVSCCDCMLLVCA
jgi:hypothetical protein